MSEIHGIKNASFYQTIATNFNNQIKIAKFVEYSNSRAHTRINVNYYSCLVMQNSYVVASINGRGPVDLTSLTFFVKFKSLTESVSCLSVSKPYLLIVNVSLSTAITWNF